MSAVTQSGIETSAERAYADLVARMRELDSSRRLRRFLIRAFFATASSILLLILFGTVDLFFQLRPAFREIFVATLLAAFLCTVGWAGLRCIRIQSLESVAGDVSRFAISRENSIVTLVGFHVGRIPAGRNIVPLLTSQAARELETVDQSTLKQVRTFTWSYLAFSFSILTLLLAGLIFPAKFRDEAKRLFWFPPNVANVAPASSSSSNQIESLNGISISELSIEAVPPAYTGLPVQVVQPEASVKVPVNSIIRVKAALSEAPDTAQLTYNGAPASGGALTNSRYTGSLLIKGPGVLQFALESKTRKVPSPVVLAVETYADAVPQARILAPSTDQILHNVPEKPIDIKWAATDDFGLADATVKYIRSRGNGDAAKFQNGNISTRAEQKSDAKAWAGTASLDIARLEGQPGDTFVVWVEARDRNPFVENVGRSSGIAIAIAEPSLTKLDLMDLKPNEIAKFLLSERQIINSTEKLQAEKTRIESDEFLKCANEIAADQREFKNSFKGFINIEGGADEAPKGSTVEEQAANVVDDRTTIHDHGIPDAPEGSPERVKELTLAIRAMWDAEDALSNGDTAKALVSENQALASLKKAQASIRYIPPILPRHVPVDVKRRYEGELDEIKNRAEKIPILRDSKENVSTREALTRAINSLELLNRARSNGDLNRSRLVEKAADEVTRAISLLSEAGTRHGELVAKGIAELKVVENQLGTPGDSNSNAAGRTEVFDKSSALLRQAISTIFVLVDSRTSTSSADVSNAFTTGDSRASRYFRKLAGVGEK